MKHLLETADFTKENLQDILEKARDIHKNPHIYSNSAHGKVLASLFYEPSTRTRLSFESAMLHLGGSNIGFSDASFSSVRKGETPEDTARIVSGYCDIMAVRHPIAFTQWRMAKVSEVPLINAGDGANEHPTQTLTDLLTIYEKFGRLDHLTVGLCGDLKYGRTVHSLVKVMALYEEVSFYFIAPEALQMPEDILEMLKEKGKSYVLSPSIESCAGQLDLLYMTRIQKERLEDPSEFEGLAEGFVLSARTLPLLSPNMIIMHPLPRIDEITPDVDADPRAWYFAQAKFGLYVRMALILHLLHSSD